VIFIVLDWNAIYIPLTPFKGGISLEVEKKSPFEGGFRGM
jgi:hypothetical protein